MTDQTVQTPPKVDIGPTAVYGRLHFLLGKPPIRVRTRQDGATHYLELDVDPGHGIVGVSFSGTRDQLRDLVAEIVRVAEDGLADP